MNFAKTTSEIGKQLKKAKNYMSNNSKLLNNKYLLYFILILVTIDMFLFVRVGEVFYIFLYILFGLLVSLQTNNMMIILASSMILTNIVKFFMKAREKEGFTMPHLGQEVYEALGEDEQEYFRQMAEGKVPRLEGLEGDEKEAVDQILEYLLGEDKEVEALSEKEDTTEEASEPKKAEKPKKEEDPVQELAGFSKDKKPKNIQGLEADAQKLIQTQKALQENMKSLEPMLKQAESFMSDLKKIQSSDKKK